MLTFVLLKFYFLFRFEKGKPDKHILDYLLDSTRYDKRLLPPAFGKY